MSQDNNSRVNPFEDFTGSNSEQVPAEAWQQNIDELLSAAKSQEQRVMGRRALLKAMAGVVGAGVMLSLPRQWHTPVVEVGTLPAHAQGSVTTTSAPPPTTTTITTSTVTTTTLIS